MAQNQVQSEFITDGAITSAKLAVSAAVANIGAGGITTNEIADANVTPAKLSQPLTQGTAQATTSGTSKDFTGIPSWVKRITVMLKGVSTSGTSNLLIQIGSGSVTSTGYTSASWSANVNNATSTAGFIQTAVVAAVSTFHGSATICSMGSNIWVESHALGDNSAQLCNSVGGGSVTLAGAIDRVRVTTVNGTDTFDAGSINILYE